MRYWLQLGVFFLIFSSCEDPITLEGANQLLTDAKIVTISNFSPLHGFTSEISVSGRVTNSDSIQFVEDATVQIFRGEDPEAEYIENLRLRFGKDDNFQKPFYVSNDAQVVEGEVYTLKVQARDLQEVKAVDRVPFKPIVTNVSLDAHEKVVVSGSNRNIRENQVYFSFDIEDEPDQIDFYHVAYVEMPIISFSIRNGGDTVFTDFETRRISIDNILDNDPSTITLNQKPGFLIEDELFDGETKRFSCQVTTTLDARSFFIGEIIIHCRRVSTSYFQFQSSLSNQLAVENTPFTEPVILHNNITNGLGNFAAYSTALDTIPINN